MIRLYGSPITRAQRVMWMLDELGLEYEHIGAVLPTKLPKSISAEEIKELNPSGKVPVLVDGDWVLTESFAINLYLAMHYESDLTPRSHREWGEAWQWTSWVANEIDKELTKAIGVRRGGLLGSLNEEQLEQDRIVRGGVQVTLGTLEKRLESESSLVGDRFTVADLNVAAVLALAEPAGIDVEPLPRTRDWLQRCLARPASRSAWGKTIEDAKALGFIGDLKTPGS